MATGVLVVLVGNATKLSDFLLKSEKSYRLEAKLGVKTDTLDITGQVLEEKPVDCSEEQISNAIEKLEGTHELCVPMYSAIKKDGKKLYDLARKDQVLDEIPKKEMSFFDFKDVQINPDRFALELSCSKGSYIRTFVDEIGKVLGCGATLTRLIRTSSSPYGIEVTQKLEDIEKTFIDCESHEDVAQHILKNAPQSYIALKNTLPDWATLKIEGVDEKLLLNGQISKPVQSVLAHYFYREDQENRVKLISKRDGHLLALLEEKALKTYKIRKVFPRK